jgi:hypothetical protein
VFAAAIVHSRYSIDDLVFVVIKAFVKNCSELASNGLVSLIRLLCHYSLVQNSCASAILQDAAWT